MIVVLGEALVDLVIRPDGGVAAALGGAPFNTARACGRLGAAVRFAGSISNDRFGVRLADQLAADQVDLSLVQRTDLPTTLAAAELDEGGAATYRFYIAGTSAPALAASLEPVAADVMFTGGLGLVLEPMAAAVEQAVGAAPPDCLVMVDVNCRPKVIEDRTSYVERLGRVLGRADVVKLSDEDLDYLSPGQDPGEFASELLARGSKVVLVTAGGGAVQVVTSTASALVPVPPVSVVDTIGAGDSFDAGFLAWWLAAGQSRAGLESLDTLRAAVEAATQVSAVVCTRHGADPPWRHELPAGWSP